MSVEDPKEAIFPKIILGIIVIVVIAGVMVLGRRTDDIETLSYSCEEKARSQQCSSTSSDEEISVQVILPLQNVELKAAPIPNEAENPAPYEDVTLVTNFVIHEKGDSEKIVTDFDPPFELRVEYTAEQWRISLKNEGNPHGQPWLVYWSPKEKTWIEFENVKIDPVDGIKENGGFLVVEISSWGDPPIGIV
jgi:hypothetical protein